MPLEQIVKQIHQLSLVEKVQLIQQVLPEIEKEILQKNPSKRRSLLGICADLGTASSSEDIAEIRQEMWSNFPREDI
ncbi:hypothetical protein [Spirulina sp. 06S082]|uniref:hypothetical protein n=1 Tax=Spirulina sp. 06S082 TaxID=3110248 RepID=UPI002B21206E|nr:hypothetical protein [Spirulina sp. 06S082]MEA5469161.1 hypothetical protein [Spirulina sp. 06S082]